MPSSSSPMQNVHQNSHFLITAWKSLVFPTIKPKDRLSLFLSTGLLISTFFLVTLFFYLSLSYHHHTSIFQRSLLIDSPAFAKQEPTNISHIVFGIGSSIESRKNRQHYIELWWRPNITRGFVWLEEEIPITETWPETLPKYRVSGNTTSFKYTCQYGSRSAIRIARIVKETFELGLQNVRWFVMGDDDTVFFLENLVSVLAKYDHNEMYYIGGNSESVEQDLIHSYAMAYGGGGFAISYPLAEELVKILDGCIDRYADLYGSDQKIHGCISEIGVQVTKELGFHQVDVRGDLYGLLAAHPVAPLVSLHHLDYVEPMFPKTTQVESVKKLITAYKMDPGRTLQRSICYDMHRNWSISVSWGYNVELYRSTLLPTAIELEASLETFRTWRSWSGGPFSFNTRPVRLNPLDRPIVFFLDRVEGVGEEGRTRSMYLRYDDVLLKDVQCTVPDVGFQYVNISASKFMPELWKKVLGPLHLHGPVYYIHQPSFPTVLPDLLIFPLRDMAPRRQCCDIIEGADEASSGLQVQIRGCHRFESSTPP